MLNKKRILVRISFDKMDLLKIFPKKHLLNTLYNIEFCILDSNFFGVEDIGKEILNRKVGSKNFKHKNG